MSSENAVRNLQNWAEALTEPAVKIPSDPVEFFNEILRIKPYEYQARFLGDEEPLKVVRWCRRAGKTLIMSGDDIRFAANNPNSLTIVTMPKFTQIKEVYFQSESGIHAHLTRMKSKIYDALIAEELQTIVRFKNGSKILPEVPEPFTIRGHGPQRINIDEFNFVRKDRELWLSALLPMTLTRIVYITIASTPWNEDSVYHDMIFKKQFNYFAGNKYHPKAETQRDYYLRTWKDVMAPHGPLLPKQVEIMREQYAGDPWRWKREMDCAFVSDETSFLPSSLIIKCQNSDLDFYLFEDAPAGQFFLGWDLGKIVDPACVAIVELDSDVRRLVHCKVFKLGTPHTSVMAYIKSICDRWEYVWSVLYDKTGTKGVDEQIERAGFPRLEGVTYSKPLKHGMATFLKDLMMSKRSADQEKLPADARRRFELPYDTEVQAELNVEQWESTKGSEVYTFSHPERSHDDRFWAIAMAVKGTAPFTHSGMEVETGHVPR